MVKKDVNCNYYGSIPAFAFCCALGKNILRYFFCSKHAPNSIHITFLLQKTVKIINFSYIFYRQNQFV